MSKRNIKLYIEDIKESIKRIEKYASGLTFEEFSKDIMKIDAIVRNLSIIGEAIRNIPKEIKVKHRDIPWSDIIGLRNKVVHEYFSVDEKILWNTIKKDLPDFKKQIAKLSKKKRGI